MAYNWTERDLISQVSLPNGSAVYIKDADARAAIDELSSYTEFLGVTTTELVNGSTTNPVTIGGKQVTAKTGDIVIYDAKEFIFNGTEWAEFGDLDALFNQLGDLAFNDEASATYTPVGSVSATFTGSEATIQASGTPEGTISASDSLSGNYEPKGTISVTLSVDTASVATVTSEGTAPTFEATDATVIGEVVTSGTVPTFSATDATVVGEVLTDGAVPSFTASDATVLGAVSTAGTLPSLNASIPELSVSGETLVFTYASDPFSAGAMPTFSTATVVGSTTFNAGAMPTFSNKTVVGSTEFDGGAMPTFSNKTVVGSTTFDAGALPTFSTDEVVTGVAVSSQTFTGTKVQLDFTGSSATFEGTYTPVGSVSAAFTGSEATITVSGSASKPE